MQNGRFSAPCSEIGGDRAAGGLVIGRMVAVLAAVLLAAGAALAQPATLRAGVVEAPPFAIKGAGGSWDGISVDLFAAVAAELGIHYELVEMDRDAIPAELAAGRLDAVVGPVVVAAAAERTVDFTHAYFQSDLGVAEGADRRLTLRALSRALGSGPLVLTMAALIALTFVTGMLAWLVERRRNPGEFEPDAARGLFSGFWWATSTLTTVGYGDKSPVTVVGRVVGIVWMLATMILVAVVTAQLSATLTADRISSRVNTVSDLARVHVGNVAGSASVGPLREIGVRPVPFPDVPSGLEALSQGRIDAFVHDEPVLLWSIGSVEGVSMAPLRFAPENLAFALPEGSPLREPLNRALLDVLASNQWTIILRLYLGASP